MHGDDEISIIEVEAKTQQLIFIEFDKFRNVFCTSSFFDYTIHHY